MGMAAAIYWPRGSTQTPTTLEKRKRKGRSWKGKLPRSWKGQQGLQPPQQSNGRLEARKRLRSRKRKRNRTRHPISLRKNGYRALIRKENNMKSAVNFDRSIKKLKQGRQWRETTRFAARIIKRRSSH